jgi:hypothetical protein
LTVAPGGPSNHPFLFKKPANLSLNKTIVFPASGLGEVVKPLDTESTAVPVRGIVPAMEETPGLATVTNKTATATITRLIIRVFNSLPLQAERSTR